MRADVRPTGRVDALSPSWIAGCSLSDGVTRPGSIAAAARARSRAATSHACPFETRYHLEHALGSGGMGSVIRARDVALGRTVAIKLMHEEMAREPAAVARFFREARVMANLKSANALRIHDVATTGEGIPYYVMEYLEGTSLAERLRERGPLTPAEAGDIVIQACEALADAHAQGVTHRDIKPANLFLVRSGGGEVVRLLDFGLAKLGAPCTKEHALTTPGTVLGTPLFMSPEQINDPRTADPRSDVWSIGAVFYRAVVGRNAFDGPNVAMVLDAILRRPHLPPSIARPGLPSWIDDVIRRCLARDPAERYPSVALLAQDIAAGLATTQTRAPKHARRKKPGRTRAQRRGAFLIGFVLFAVLGSALGLSATARLPRSAWQSALRSASIGL